MTKLARYWKIALGALLVLFASAALMVDFKSASTSVIGSENGDPFYRHSLNIIIDDAHGSNVAGKGSPDGRHKEYLWSQFWSTELQKHLTDIDYTTFYNSPEETEPGLLTRVHRMNKVPAPAFVFSWHNNAAGMGDSWKDAHGYSVWTTRGVTMSDTCATIIFNNLRTFLPDLAFRQDLSDGDPDYESNFTVLMSKHPSVLFEFMFQDNNFDLQLLENPALCRTILLILDVSMLQIEQVLTKQTTKKAA